MHRQMIMEWRRRLCQLKIRSRWLAHLANSGKGGDRSSPVHNLGRLGA